MSSLESAEHSLSNKKIAVVHDWCFSRRGGERVLESILNLFPNAELFLLFGDSTILVTKNTHVVRNSFLNKIPTIKHVYKALLPLFPFAVESLNLSGYDLVISSSSCAAKGAIVDPTSFHVCYLHSPMRYAWDQRFLYAPSNLSWINPIKIFAACLMHILLTFLRAWDVCSSSRVNCFISNSSFVASRCFMYYRRDSFVLFPPVDLKRFFVDSSPATLSDKTLLLFGSWVPYKKMGPALEHCVAMGYKIIAAGHGKQLLDFQKKYAGNPLVTFHFNPSESLVAQLFHQSHALLFPGVEDAGITPIEAQASGIFVIAPNVGGTLESVIDEETGFLFDPTTEKSMAMAIKKCLETPLTLDRRQKNHDHAKQFATEKFENSFLRLVTKEFSGYKNRTKVKVTT